MLTQNRCTRNITAKSPSHRPRRGRPPQPQTVRERLVYLGAYAERLIAAGKDFGDARLAVEALNQFLSPPLSSHEVLAVVLWMFDSGGREIPESVLNAVPQP